MTYFKFDSLGALINYSFVYNSWWVDRMSSISTLIAFQIYRSDVSTKSKKHIKGDGLLRRELWGCI